MFVTCCPIRNPCRWWRQLAHTNLEDRLVSANSFLAGCKAVITYNQGVRGGRIIELKMTVDEAVKNCPSIKHIFVAQRTDNKVHMGDHDIPLEEVCWRWYSCLFSVIYLEVCDIYCAGGKRYGALINAGTSLHRCLWEIRCKSVQNMRALPNV